MTGLRNAICCWLVVASLFSALSASAQPVVPGYKVVSVATSGAPAGGIHVEGLLGFVAIGSLCSQKIVKLELNHAEVTVAEGFGAITGIEYDSVNDRLLVGDSAGCGSSSVANTLFAVPSPMQPSSPPPTKASLAILPSSTTVGLFDLTMSDADPTGSTVLFTQNQFGPGGFGARVSSVNLVTGVVQPLHTLASGTAAGIDSTATEIVFGVKSHTPNSSSIYRMPIGGGAATLVTGGLVGQYDLRVGPDGVIVSSSLLSAGASPIVRIRLSDGAILGVPGIGLTTPTVLDVSSASIFVVDASYSAGVLMLTPTGCNDGIDNDADGDTDLNDTECFQDLDIASESQRYDTSPSRLYASSGSLGAESVVAYEVDTGNFAGSIPLPGYETVELAVNAHGQVLAVQMPQGGVLGDDRGSLLRVSPFDGVVTIVPEQGGLIHPVSVAVEPDGTYLVLDSADDYALGSVLVPPAPGAPSPGIPPSLPNARIYRVSESGQLTILAESPLLGYSLAMEVMRNGDIYVASDSPGPSYLGWVTKVDPTTGQATIAAYLDRDTVALTSTPNGKLLVSTGLLADERIDLFEINLSTGLLTLVETNLALGRSILPNGRALVGAQAGPGHEELDLTTLVRYPSPVPSVAGYTSVIAFPQCYDGLDNNDNQQIDYPADSNCQSVQDRTEIPACGLVGLEPFALLALLRRSRFRSRAMAE